MRHGVVSRVHLDLPCTDNLPSRHLPQGGLRWRRGVHERGVVSISIGALSGSAAFHLSTLLPWQD
jgi:hypothetical protein